MKNSLIIGIIIFFNVRQLTAQFDFRTGYIINNDNDTIYGLIDYRGNKANAKKCIFKNDNNSQKQIFSPEDIKSFRFINSKYYVSKNVNIGNETEQLFLEFLINGIVDIYYYRDNIGEHYFLDDGSIVLYELKNEQKEIMQNNIRYQIDSKEYIGILKVAFTASPLISKKVENVDLNHKSLINITHDYHQEVCNDEECIIYEKNLRKAKITYGIIVGLNSMSFSQTGELPDAFYYLRNSQFEFKTYPSLGIYSEVNIPFLNERLYFQYEGTYSHTDLTASNSYFEPIYKMNFINHINYTQNIFNNVGIIKYELPFDKIRPTIQIGGFVKYLFKTDYERNLEVQFDWGDTYYTKQINESPFSNFEFGFNCGFGLKSQYLKEKELIIDIRYQRGYGLLKYVNTNTILVNLGFQIGN